MTPVHEEMRAACSLFEIPQLYAAFLHLMVGSPADVSGLVRWHHGGVWG